MRCPDCHKTVALSKQFCPYCGAAMPSADQNLEKPSILQRPRYSIVEAAVAAVVTLLCVIAFQLIAGSLLALFGELMAQGFNEAVGTVRAKIFILALAGFAADCILILLNKNGRKILYYIVWGVLCVVGVLIFSFENPQTVMENRAVPVAVLLYAVEFIRTLAFSYGLGIPLLQAALYLSFHKPMSAISSSLVIVLFFMGTLGGTWLGLSVFALGSRGFMLSAIGSVLAFAISVVLNRRKEL